MRRTSFKSLQREWSILGTATYGILLVISIFISVLSGLQDAARWFIPSALWLVLLLLEVRRLLPENHRPNDNILIDHLGVANLVTISRGFLFVCAGGFLLLPAPTGRLTWIPGLLYTIAIILDRLDGYLARRSGQVSVMGAQMDMRFDALGILIVTLLGIRWGQLPWWYISIGVVFYLYDLGLRTRHHRNKPVYSLPENPNRPVLAGMQMGFLAVSLWLIFSSAVLYLAALVFGLPLLVTFIRDWLFASGRLSPESRWFRKFTRSAGKATQTVILPGIRIGTVLLVSFLFLKRPGQVGSLGVFLSGIGLSLSIKQLAFIFTILSLGLLLGIMPRICALAVMAFSGAFVMIFPLLIFPKILLVVTGVLLLYGPGQWKLLDLEERLLYRTNLPPRENPLQIS